MFTSLRVSELHSLLATLNTPLKANTSYIFVFDLPYTFSSTYNCSKDKRHATSALDSRAHDFDVFIQLTMIGFFSQHDSRLLLIIMGQIFEADLTSTCHSVFLACVSY